MLGMNKLDRETRARVLHLLCEGQSIRAATRLTGVSKKAVMKLVVDAGHACTEYQDRVLRNLTSQRVQVDEIWNFIYAKNDNVKDAKGLDDALRNLRAKMVSTPALSLTSTKVPSPLPL